MGLYIHMYGGIQAYRGAYRCIGMYRCMECTDIEVIQTHGGCMGVDKCTGGIQMYGSIQMYEYRWGAYRHPQTYRQPDIIPMPANYTWVLYFLSNLNFFTYRHIMLAHQLA